MFKQALKLIKEHDTIILHRHSKPDGDAMGSQIGMKHLIRDNFPQKEVFAVGDNPRRFAFIAEGCLMDEIPDSKYDGALVIILDTPTEDMVCDDRFRLAAKTIRFDHHLFTKKYTDCEVIDSSYESCSGLVADFAVESGLTVSSEAATALYTGIVTDSGRFRFDATSSDTFRRAAFLMKCGIKLESIYGNLYDTDFESVVLRAKFALMIRLTENKVGYIYSTKKDLEELGVSAFEAARGFVNTMADITGVKIWVAFAEADEGILCELRSSSYNINPVAVKYGGGGHAKASGATVPNREIAIKMLKDLDRMAQSE